MFEQRGTTNAGAAMWPGGNGREESSSNRSSKHYPVPPIWFDSCTADVRVVPHRCTTLCGNWHVSLELALATPGSSCYNNNDGPNRHSAALFYEHVAPIQLCTNWLTYAHTHTHTHSYYVLVCTRICWCTWFHQNVTTERAKEFRIECKNCANSWIQNAHNLRGLPRDPEIAKN